MDHVPGKDHHEVDAMSQFPVEKPKGDKSWRLLEPARKPACRQAEDADDLEMDTKVVVQAALCSDMTTTGEAHTVTS